MNTLITNRYEMVNGAWSLVSTTEEACTLEKWYDNIVDKKTLKFFRGLGGKETVDGFTCTSLSPNGLEKTVRKLVNL